MRRSGPIGPGHPRRVEPEVGVGAALLLADRERDRIHLRSYLEHVRAVSLWRRRARRPCLLPARGRWPPPGRPGAADRPDGRKEGTRGGRRRGPSGSRPVPHRPPAGDHVTQDAGGHDDQRALGWERGRCRYRHRRPVRATAITRRVEYRFNPLHRIRGVLTILRISITILRKSIIAIGGRASIAGRLDRDN